MSQRASDASSTRYAIIRVARDILVEQGHLALSMRKVASRVGVSAPAIYRHFESKDALLSAAVHAGAQAFGAYLVDALSEPKPWARLRKMAARYFDFAREHRQDYLLLFLLDCRLAGLPQLDERAQEETQSTFQLLVDRVQECQKSGDLKRGDASKMATFIWASLHGLASLESSQRLAASGSEFEGLVRAQIDGTLAALAAPGKKLAS